MNSKGPRGVIKWDPFLGDQTMQQMLLVIFVQESLAMHHYIFDFRSCFCCISMFQKHLLVGGDIYT